MIQQQDNKKDYALMLQELGISILTGAEQDKTEQDKSCHYKQVKNEIGQEKSFKIKSLESFSFLKSCLYSLRYQEGFWLIKISSLNPTNANQTENKDAVK